MQRVRIANPRKGHMNDQDKTGTRIGTVPGDARMKWVELDNEEEGYPVIDRYFEDELVEIHTFSPAFARQLP